MICPHCRNATTVVAGKCGLCQKVIGPPSVATAVLTPPPSSTTQPISADPPTQTGAGATWSSAPTGTFPTSPAGGPLAPGQQFARYHIIRLLGAGGMGAVYQAWDGELGVAVAIKVVRPDASADPTAAADLDRRFKRELLLAREVTHKNVVRIHDLGDVEGIKYITMPYIQGRDLASMLKTRGALPVALALRIAKQVAAGLEAAHEAGVVHRDLKPANIMVDDDDHALIMDFGIARSTGSHGATMTVGVVGTVAYMAPEQARAEQVDHRADIYAFGLILHDMLIGRRKMAGSDSALAELMERIQHAPPPVRTVNPDIPEALEAIVDRCLQPDRAHRFQRTGDVVAALEALDENGTLAPARMATERFTAALAQPPGVTPQPVAVAPQPVAVAPQPATPDNRRRIWVASAAALAIVIVTLGVIYRLETRSAESSPATAATRSVSLAILPFRNASGDPSLDWLGATFAEMLRSELGQSEHLRTLPSDRLQQILRDLRIPADSSFDPATLRRLADFSSSDTVVWGQLLKFGNEIQINATLEDVKGGRAVPLKAQAVNEAAMMGTVSTLATLIRDGLAFTPDIISELQATAFKPSSQSLAAIRAYNEGLQLTREGKNSEAVKRFEAATAEDPSFALAYSRLGQAQAALGYDTDAERFSRKAVELSEGLPPREKYLIEASHASIVNDATKAIESYENLLKAAPDDAAVQIELARLYENTGALDAARDLYAKVVARDANYMDALLALGRVEIRRRNPQASLDYLNRALTLAITLDSQEPKANILQAIGIAYKRLNKPQEALRYYTEALEIKRQLGQKGSIAGTLNEIAQVQLQLGRPAEALKAYQDALTLRREIGDVRGTGNTLLDLGVFHADRGEYDQALKLYKESLQIWRQVGNANYEALTLNNIGNAYLISGSYDDALTYFERALQLREKSNIPAETALVLQNLATTSASLGNYDGALKYHLRALELWRAAGDRRQAATESFRMADVFAQQGLIGAALKAHGDAVTAMRELQDRSPAMAEILAGYASALGQAGKFDEAAKTFAEALALARELKQPSVIAQALNQSSRTSFLKGDVAAARESSTEALRIATDIKDRRLLLAARAGLARADATGRSQVAVLRSCTQEADAVGERFLAVECAIDAAAGMIAARDYPAAQVELERTLVKADRLGARVLQARAHHLLGVAFRGLGRAADASRHERQATRLLEEIRREAGADTVVKRADLSSIASQ